MRHYRICMVIDYLYPVVGGSEIQAHRLARELLRRGLSPFFVTRKQRYAFPVSYDMDVHGFPVFGRGRIASLSFLFRIIPFLIRHRSEYDIIHCHLATSTALGCIIAGSLANKPVIIKLGCSGKAGDIQTSSSSLGGRIKLAFLKIARCNFVAPSMDVEKEMLDAGFSPKRIAGIPNGVDTGFFHALSSEEKSIKKAHMEVGERNIVLYMGRLEAHKNIIHLIEAWSGLDDTADGWRLWVIGSGSLEGHIRALIRTRGMGERILLSPSVLPEQVRDYLQIADIFIQPSISEGISNAILEAMSCGLTVLASDIDANKGLIEDGINGLLFDPYDVSGISGCIKEALQDERDRKKWGRNARASILKNKDLSDVAERYIRLYDHTLYQKSAP